MKNRSDLNGQQGRAIVSWHETTVHDGGPCHKRPIHLTNEEIVHILRMCFPVPFELYARNAGGEVTLMCRGESTFGTVDFWIRLDTGGRVKNYAGTFGGMTDVDVVKGLGQSVFDCGKDLSDDWEGFFRIPVYKIYHYLGVLGFFEARDGEPPENEALLGPKWKQIYQQQY